MKQNINQDIAMAIFNSTDRPSQSRNIVSLREKVESYSKQRVIEELEELLTKEIESFGVNVISSQAVINKINQLKQD